MESRDCFPLGRGLTTLLPSREEPSELRPFGMTRARTIAAAIADDVSDVLYDEATQTLALTNPTGDPELDAITLGKKTTSSRATDRDGSTPTTPKDLQTDED